MTDEINRREFVKKAVVATAALAGASPSALQAVAQATADPNEQVVAALGALFVPSASGDPGYRDLERYGITAYVMQKLPADGSEPFNSAAKQFFDGKSFLDLDEKQREQYLELIVDAKRITDEKLRLSLQIFYRAARARILSVYYKNFPEHEVNWNDQREMILKPGDQHQISDPNTTKLVTGWDVASYTGPMDWAEEEQRRNRMKKLVPYWYEGDQVKLVNPRPSPPAVKTVDGHDYYDVLVVGGGTAGCVVAGRLAERGMNPKTGDRLRVAMIEGGDDWTIRDPGLRPGYGYPERRRRVSNIADSEKGPEGSPPADPVYRWPAEGSNFKIVGGCSIHYGGEFFMPGADDFRVYREVTGVDWTTGKFEEAIQEIRNFFPLNVYPSETMSKGVRMFSEVGESMGYEMWNTPVGRINCLACRHCTKGKICRQDAKATSLPWAYIGLNNGMKVIANADVDRILIEKPGSGRLVATGVAYKDKAGQTHEVRAARVIVATGAVGTAQLLYRSGYGPRDYLGDKLLVENKNVGRHLDVDLENNIWGISRNQSTPEDDGSGVSMLTTIKPKPWGELTTQLIGALHVSIDPHDAALRPFAPQFGWKHKEYMRSKAHQRIGRIRNIMQYVPWEWRVTPDGRIPQVSVDAVKVNAAAKEAAELSRTFFEKMPVKPLEIDARLVPIGTFVVGPFGHETGTARAGTNPENTVCTSDFDSHDVDHLMFTSGASIPRTLFSHGCGPAMVFGAYAWRRFVENHFSRGSSTKGFA